MKKTPQLVKKPFAHHLLELRMRLLWVVAIFIIGSVIGYFFSNPLITVILYPLHQSVYYTSPIGGFNVVMTISLLVGILTAIPMLLYQSFLFAKPLLPVSLIRKAPWVIFFSFFLLLIGILFAYFVALPASLHFFAKFSTSEVKSLISANDYLSFVTRYLVGFGILFQLPLILLIINSVIPLSFIVLLSMQRYVIVGAFLMGAILSPDPFNMFLMAGPIIFLFYLSVILILVVNNRKRGIKKRRKNNS